MQMVFQVKNRAVSALPDLLPAMQPIWYAFAFKYFWMHLCYQHFFIIGAIEYANSSSLRQANYSSPQKIMFEFLQTWMLEAENLATLRVDSRHYMFDCTVFSCGIHGLKDQ